MQSSKRVCCLMPEGVLPNARGRELANFAQQVAPGQPLSLPFIHSLIHLSCTHTCTRMKTHTQICLHTQRTLSAPGCQDAGERQCCHCVVLYYTWNSEPHAFLIEVICTGTACVSVYSVSETVLALIYIPLSHCNCSSEDINHRPWYRRLPNDIVFIMHSDLREKIQLHPLYKSHHSLLSWAFTPQSRGIVRRKKRFCP